jgi:hypothetical protein
VVVPLWSSSKSSLFINNLQSIATIFRVKQFVQNSFSCTSPTIFPETRPDKDDRLNKQLICPQQEQNVVTGRGVRKMLGRGKKVSLSFSTFETFLILTTPKMNQHVTKSISEYSRTTVFPMEFTKPTAGIAPPTMAFTDEVLSNKEKNETKKKPKVEQPKDKPKRPLSAYNLFFQHERGEILRATPERAEGKPRRSHGKIGFADLARNIAANWKSIDPESRSHFDKLAAKDKERYKTEMDVWKKKQELKKQAMAADFEPIALVSPDLCQQDKKVPPFSVSDMLGMGAHPPLYTVGGQEVIAPEPIPIASLDNQSSQWAHKFSSVYKAPPLSDLASDLDDDCKQLLTNMFQG